LAAEQHRDYPVSRIAPHTYVIIGPVGYPSVENQGFMNNPGFVITQTGVVVIDPGSSVQSGRMVLKQLRSITRKPVTHVINTHVHGDHWLGNQAIAEAYPKARLMAHPEMIRLANLGAGAEWVALMDKSTNGFTSGTRAVVPDNAMNDGSALKVGGITFRFYAPKDAHSHTDIMIEVVEDSVVFAGDNVLNQRIARMDDATFAGNIAACDAAALIKARVYVPGHGPVGDISVVLQFRNYLSTLFNTVRVLHEQGKLDFEMKDAVAAKLTPYQNWPGFSDELGRHISLAVLELDAF
jgi:glyoxylase-like metal-dependent hydrolase (beta-lactamase superfamily II)